MYQKIKAYIPLFLCEFYWNITYIIYRFGVIEWPLKKDKKVLIFILLCDFCFALGYLLRTRKTCYDNKREFQTSQQYLEKILFMCNFIGILAAIPNSIRYTGNWYPRLLVNIHNAGDTYLNMVSQISTKTSINFIAFFDIFVFLIPPLTMFTWDILNKKLRITGVILSVYYLIIYCSSGRNMPSVLFMISIIITYFVYVCSNWKISKRTLLRNTIIVLGTIALGIGMFQLNLSSRTYYDKNVENELQAKGEEKISDSLIYDDLQNTETSNNLTDFEEKEGELQKSDSISDDDQEKTKDEEKISDSLIYDDLQNTETSNNLTDFEEKEGELQKSDSISDDDQEKTDEEIYLKYKDLVILQEQAEKCEEVSQIFPMYANPYTKAYVNINDFTYKHIPDSLKFIYVMGDQYLCGNYHVLSVGLRMDFKWTYGIGFSEFLMDYLQRFTGIDVKGRSYGSRAMALTEPSIVSTYGWSTAYVQMAGDVGFIGVILLFGALGYICSFVWNDAIQYNNIYAVPFIIQMAVLLLAIPINCITFNSGGYFVNFWGTFFLWIFAKKKERKKERKKDKCARNR